MSCIRDTMKPVGLVVFAGVLMASAGVVGADPDCPEAFASYSETQRRALAGVEAIYGSLRGREGLSDAQAELMGLLEGVVHNAHAIRWSGEPGDTSSSLRLTTPELAAALQWLASEESAAQGDIGSQRHLGPVLGISSRLGTLLRGGGGFMLAGMPVVGGAAGDGLLDQRWGGFLNFSGAAGRQSATERENALDFEGFGVDGGVDYRFSSDWVAGGALAWSRSDADFDPSRGVTGGGIEVDSVAVSAYALYTRKRFSFNAIAGYGRGDYDIARRVRYLSNDPAVASRDLWAEGSSRGVQWSLSTGVGYHRNFNRWNLDVGLDADYATLDLDGYTERGAGVLNLRVEEQDVESLVTRVTVAASRVWNTPYGVVMPRLGLGYHHQFEDGARALNARFAVDPEGEFIRLRSDDPDRDFGEVSASLATVLPGGFQAFAAYDALVGLRDTRSHRLTLGLRGEF